MKHFQINDLLLKNLSGFRLNPFMSHSFNKTYSYLAVRKKRKKKLCGALFIDFAKAFNVVSHGLLLTKIKLYRLTTGTLI